MSEEVKKIKEAIDKLERLKGDLEKGKAKHAVYYALKFLNKSYQQIQQLKEEKEKVEDELRLLKASYKAC